MGVVASHVSPGFGRDVYILCDVGGGQSQYILRKGSLEYAELEWEMAWLWAKRGRDCSCGSVKCRCVRCGSFWKRMEEVGGKMDKLSFDE